MLHLVLRLRGGGEVKPMGIAAGGKIKQKVYADDNDPNIYDYDHGARVYVHAINAMAWK